MSEGAAMSKSAKKRAAQKARDAKAAEEAAKPAVEEPKKAEAKPKAQPKADAKAKAQPKADAKPKAEPAPKADAKPKAESKPAAKPKAEPKGGKKKDAKPEPAPAPEPKKDDTPAYIEFDDGKGGAWEEVAAGPKKNIRRKQRQAEEAAMAGEGRQVSATIQKQNNAIPGNVTASAADLKAARKDINQFVASVSEKAAANRKAAEGAASDQPEKPAEKTESSRIKVPEEKIGRVIGPKGSNLKIITEKTGVSRIDTEGEWFTISGKPECVAIAEAALRELIEKGYMSLAFDDFQEIFVMAHPSTFPDIIGKGGEMIRRMKEQLKVEIDIPSVPKNSSGAKKYKVGIAGSKEAAEKAKKCLEDIIMYGHSEVTHPGQVHEELEAPEWSYRFIIGKAGSELRHIQKNWNVKVSIPRENSSNPNVVIVGDPKDVERAKAYIEKQIYAAENQQSGRDKANQSEDHWGDEEEEPWMAAYMYKRK